MAITLDGTAGISTPGMTNTGNESVSGTTTLSTGILNIGSGQIYKDASGNVGIGTSSPGSKLEVNGNVKFNGTTAELGYGQYPVARLNGNTNNAIFGFALDGSQSGAYNGRDWRIEQGRSAAGQFNITDITAGNIVRATLDSSGNLGLGVTPSAWGNQGKALQIGAQGAFAGYQYSAANNQVWFGNNCYTDQTTAFKYIASNPAANLRIANDGLFQWNIAPSGTAGNTITFTQAMTLDASGNLLVGTTNQFDSEKFNVTGTSTTVCSFVNTTNTSGYNGVRVSIEPNGNNTSTYHFRGTTRSIANWYLYGNGTTSYTSDERQKKNIETTRDGYLSDLNKLRVVKYNWLNHDDDAPKELGLIAQEVEQVFPGLVQDHDLDGVEGTRKVIKHSVMEFILVKAIQELTARLEALEAK